MIGRSRFLWICCFIGLLMVLIASAGSGEVIAGPEANDQSSEAGPSAAPATAPAQASGSVGGLGVQDVIVIVLAGLIIAGFLLAGWHRLDRAPPRPQAFTPAIGLLLFAAFLVLGQAGVGTAARVFAIDLATVRADPAAELSLHDQARLTLGQFIGQAGALIVFLYLLVAARRRHPESRPSPWRAALIGAGMLLLAMPVVWAASDVAALVVWLTRGEVVDPIAHETLRLFMKNPIDGWFIALAAMVIFIAPLMEEVVHRGLMQGVLVQIGAGRWPAIGLTSAYFAVRHGGITAPYALGALFLFSVSLGWVYEKSGRLAAPITMHMLFNALNLAIALTIR